MPPLHILSPAFLAFFIACTFSSKVWVVQIFLKFFLEVSKLLCTLVRPASFNFLYCSSLKSPKEPQTETEVFLLISFILSQTLSISLSLSFLPEVTIEKRNTPRSSLYLASFTIAFEFNNEYSLICVS